MITVVSDKKEILQLHQQFQKKLKSSLVKPVDCWVGHPGGNFEDKVHYSDKLNIWLSHSKHDTRFWNGFGIGHPKEGTNNSLVGEINFPFGGINRSIAGVFAVDEKQKVLVLHRGRIGGGKKGIGKDFFMNNFRGDFITATDGDRQNEFCLVGELDSAYFPRQVANFISEIYRVKNMGHIKQKPGISHWAGFNYLDEYTGNIVTEQDEPRTIHRTHGIIVNALAAQMEKKGFKIGNDKNRDLFIYRGINVIALFEIKTSSSTQDLYTAIGQLLLYSIPMDKKVKLFVVLPERLNPEVNDRFEFLGIKVIYYKMENENVSFQNIEKYF